MLEVHDAESARQMPILPPAQRVTGIVSFARSSNPASASSSMPSSASSSPSVGPAQDSHGAAHRAIDDLALAGTASSASSRLIGTPVVKGGQARMQKQLPLAEEQQWERQGFAVPVEPTIGELAALREELVGLETPLRRDAAHLKHKLESLAHSVARAKEDFVATHELQQRAKQNLHGLL